MSSDPLRGVQCELGFDGEGKRLKHTFKFTLRAVRTAEQRLDRKPLREIFRAGVGDDILCELAAAALMHEMKDASDALIERWLDEDPEAYWPVYNAVIGAWNEAQKRRLPPDLRKGEEGGSSGEASPPKSASTAAPSAAGQTSDGSSGPAADTASPPT